MAPLAADAIPTVSAYGRSVVQTEQASEGPTHHVNADIAVMMNDVFLGDHRPVGGDAGEGIQQ
mgnify:CR=1 FL=1